MKFKYIGDREDFTFRGISFPVGVPVEVTDSGAISKLENNGHFEKVLPKLKKTKAVNHGNSGGNKRQSSI